MDIANRRLSFSSLLRILLFLTAGVLLVVWLNYTPGGVFGKADAIGYAVCHRIASRSFQINGHQVPLCARCSGMFLGALLGIVYQAFFKRQGGLPKKFPAVVFVLFAAAFGFDGLNSYLHFFPNAPVLYDPNNMLRLFTGTGMGLSISSMIVPAFNQTVWTDWVPTSVFATWKPLAGLAALALVLDLAILTENPVILYPLALLSAVGVVVLLAMIYTMIWVMVFRKENRFLKPGQLIVPLVGGLTTAMLQIAVIDLLRFWLTGTWQGFNL